MLVMNQKAQQVFSIGQQSKFQKLQLEVAALEEEVANYLQQQTPQSDHNSHPPIPLIYVNDQIAKTGIRLPQDTHI